MGTLTLGTGPNGESQDSTVSGWFEEGLNPVQDL